MRENRAPEGRDGPLYVPRNFEEEYLDEARRAVEQSHGRRRRPHRPARRRRPRAWRVDTPGARFRAVLYVMHGLAALLVVMFAILTRTWLVGAVVLAGIAVSLGLWLHLSRVAVRAWSADGPSWPPIRRPPEDNKE